MAQSEFSLADLIADDEGNIRPEVAHIFMEAPPRRPRRLRPVLEQGNNQQGQWSPWVWIILVLIISSTFFVIKSCSKDDGIEEYLSQNDRTKHNNPMKTEIGKAQEIENHRTGEKYRDNPAQSSEDQSTPIIEKPEVVKRPSGRSGIERQEKKPDAFVKIPVQSPPTTEQGTKPTLENTMKLTTNQQKYLGKASIFGVKVNIRRYPRLSSRVIRQARARETFSVISFAKGWYKVVIGNGQTAYIFGAYLLPINFINPTHVVGIDNQGRKILVSRHNSKGYLEKILPSGDTRPVKEKNVQIINE